MARKVEWLSPIVRVAKFNDIVREYRFSKLTLKMANKLVNIIRSRKNMCNTRRTRESRSDGGSLVGQSNLTILINRKATRIFAFKKAIWPKSLRKITWTN